MFLKYVLLGIVVLTIFDLLTKLKLKHRLYKDLQQTQKRQETFKDKMKKLEIK